MPFVSLVPYGKAKVFSGWRVSSCRHAALGCFAFLFVYSQNISILAHQTCVGRHSKNKLVKNEVGSTRIEKEEQMKTEVQKRRWCLSLRFVPETINGNRKKQPQERMGPNGSIQTDGTVGSRVVVCLVGACPPAMQSIVKGARDAPTSHETRPKGRLSRPAGSVT